jgi:hypothetical protein
MIDENSQQYPEEERLSNSSKVKSPHTPKRNKKNRRNSSIKQEGTKLSPIRESYVESDSESRGGRKRITRRRK